MNGMLRHKFSFLQIEKACFRFIIIGKAKAEERSQVQGEVQWEIGYYRLFRIIEVHKGIFDKMIEIGIGLGLLDRFLQQLYHKQCYGIAEYIRENTLIQITPFVFFEPLQVFLIMMVYHQVQYSGGLKHARFAGIFL